MVPASSGRVLFGTRWMCLQLRNTMSGDDTAASAIEGAHGSIWLETIPETEYDALSTDRAVDVAVVGGGIAGVTAAYHLSTAGQEVAVIERDRLLSGTTGYTTAKLTSQHGLVYADLVEAHGEQRAREYAEANEAAIDQVDSIAAEHDIDCDFERLPAFAYLTDPAGRDRIREEVQAAKRLGLPASYTDSTALPFDVAGAIRFDDQAQFHPGQYLQGLAEIIVEQGGSIYENTTATDVSGGSRCHVETDGGRVRADDVVVATHFPIVDHGFYFARMKPKRSYVLAARLAGDVPEGMYYDDTDPYFSVRPHPAGDESLVLVGGQNHRTGAGGSTKTRYEQLAREARLRFDVEEIVYRWSTQDFAAVDNIPFVGTLPVIDEGIYVATGFGGWGMTNGTAAGRILADRILGREPPWAEVYRPSRLSVSGGLREFVSHNADAAGRFVGDRVESATAGPPADLGPDEARVVRTDDGPVAVYRDESRAMHAVSAVCPHMGCLVEWNDGERSWDCPCHGSRFDVDGSVLDTPAVSDLEEYDISKLADDRRNEGHPPED